MTSKQSRTRSQAHAQHTPQKTRVIYKNTPEEFSLTQKHTLYEDSYTMKNQPRTPQHVHNKTVVVEKLTLADIGSMSAIINNKSSIKKRDSESEAPKSRQASRRGNFSGDLFAKIVNTAQSGTQDNFNKTASVKFGQYTVPNTPAVQKFYDSQSMKEAMTKEFSGCPHINVNDEADYYEAVKSLDVCGKCWADQKKYYPTPFKVNHKGPGLSLYQRDFVKHPIINQGPMLTNDFYSTRKVDVPVDYATTMRSDFKAWEVGTPKRETADSRPATSGIPLSGNSNYRLEYANWGANMAAYEKAPNNKTVITELPFMSSTTYGDNFMPNHQHKKVGLLKPKMNKSPLTTGVPFLGESTNSATYKPFKVDKLPYVERSREYHPTEALPENLRSLYSKDFKPPVEERCPARVFIENNVHPRQKHLST